jgi:hypothetical protein
VLLLGLANCTISDSVIAGTIARFLVSNATFTFQNCAFDDFEYNATNGGSFEMINCSLNVPVTGFHQACAAVTTIFLPTPTASGTPPGGLGVRAIVGIAVGGVAVIAVIAVIVWVARRRSRLSNPGQNESASPATGSIVYKKLINEEA